MSPKEPLMQAIRTLGRLPKETRTATQDERLLANRLNKARREGKVSCEEEAELAAMSANDFVPMAAMSAASNPAALPPSSGSANRTQPPDPEQQAQLAPLSSGEQKRKTMELIEQDDIKACSLDNCANSDRRF